MEWQSGPQHGSHHQIFLRQGDIQCTKRRGNRLGLIIQRLGELIRHHLAYALDIVTEKKAVLLIILVAQLRHIEVDNRVALTEINYFHNLNRF